MDQLKASRNISIEPQIMKSQLIKTVKCFNQTKPNQTILIVQNNPYTRKSNPNEISRASERIPANSFLAAIRSTAAAAAADGRRPHKTRRRYNEFLLTAPII